MGGRGDWPVLVSSCPDATYRALMTMLPVFDDLRDRGGPGLAAVVLAGTQAGSGSVALQPSLSASARAARPAVAGVSELAAQLLIMALAELGQLMVDRLGEAAVEAVNPLDRLACTEAAWHAQDLSVYLGGASPG